MEDKPKGRIIESANTSSDFTKYLFIIVPIVILLIVIIYAGTLFKGFSISISKGRVPEVLLSEMKKDSKFGQLLKVIIKPI
ncbi:hypothetical protein ACFLZ1_03210 [Patescibacteria group bacterium]